MSFFPLKRLVPRENRRGVALVLVLAFVVLLASIIVAFFSRALAEQQISRSSANQTKVRLLTDGAVDTIIGDLKSEIAAGSTSASITAGGVTTTLYAPKSNTGQTYAQNTGAYTTMLPATQGFAHPATGADPLANLVKVSANAPFYSGAAYGSDGPTRAAESLTTAGTRSISLARWNKPLFLASSSTTDLTPPGTFPTPNWIYVADDGTNKKAVDSKVIGRYAYVIYDEGGLLDVNVAGYPSTLNPTAATPDVAYKNAQAYADLTQIGLTQSQVNALVNWRNEATQSTADGYKEYVAANTNGFLRTANTALTGGVSDRMFSGRQQFIEFLKNKIPGFNKNTQDTLQYLTTFSREIDQPSVIRLQSTNPGKNTAPIDHNPDAPHVLPAINGGNNYAGSNLDDKVNPTFLGVRAANQFTRSDGSRAQAGEALVKSRFALSRLAWLTYRGPSAERNTSASGITGVDGDIGLLKQNGITKEWLDQGTRENIRNYFGLTWDTDANGHACWKYNVHNGPSGSSATGPIMMLEDIAQLGTPHDPDFFELLKASISVGSLGKALVTSNRAMPQDSGAESQEMQPFNYNHYLESSVDVQVIQIGANIISQYQTSNYPARIVFDDGSGAAQMPHIVAGVSNLPYLSTITTGVLQVQSPGALPRNGRPAYTGSPGSGGAGDSGYQASDSIGVSGVGAVMQLPTVWNPHDPTSSVGASGAGPTQFRVVADSTTPDRAESGVAGDSIFVYAASKGTTVSGTSPAALSFNADGSSPGAGSSGNSWYRGSPSTLARPITADSTAIEFTLQSGTRPIFPEPTMLARAFPSTPLIDNNGNRILVSSGSLSGIRNWAPVSSLGGSSGSLSIPGSSNADIVFTNTGTRGPFLGFYLGAAPLAWKSTASSTFLSVGQSGVFIAKNAAGLPAGSETACYFTYRMQYRDPSGGWVTYDTKYAKTFDDATQIAVNGASLICGNGIGAQPGSGGFWASGVDPRSSRFGMFFNGTYPLNGEFGINSPFATGVGYYLYKPLPGYGFRGFLNMDDPSHIGGWLNMNYAISLSVRPDTASGWFTMAGWPYYGGGNQATSILPQKVNNNGMAAGWMCWVFRDGNGYPGLYPGLLTQNNTSIPQDFERYYDTGVTTKTKSQPNYFADPDGMVRRGMGAFVPPNLASSEYASQTTVGLPMARAFGYQTASPQTAYIPPWIKDYNGNPASQSTNQAQSRPYFLHRPFRSVAELGYVFSDTPWRNLDFFTSESGSAVLLDTFCINETSDSNALVAGKINLNTRQAPPLKAILAGACIDNTQVGSAAAPGRIDAATAGLLANALIARTTNTANGTGPLRNPSELVGRLVTRSAIQQVNGLAWTAPSAPLSSGTGFYDGKLSYSGFSGGDWDTGASKPKLSSPARDIYSAYMNSGSFSPNSNFNGTRETVTNIQRFREAPIRALSSAGQTRVWNLMVDVVAQTGRFPTNAGGLDQFQVNGEQRYWVHLAIDRFTGRVVDKQIETIKE
jgi:hypothetical protein